MLVSVTTTLSRVKCSLAQQECQRAAASGKLQNLELEHASRMTILLA
jgi:hypothetical protein